MKNYKFWLFSALNLIFYNISLVWWSYITDYILFVCWRDQDCKWIVYAPANYVIRIDILSFDLELELNCSLDRCTAYDGGEEKKRNNLDIEKNWKRNSSTLETIHLGFSVLWLVLCDLKNNRCQLHNDITSILTMFLLDIYIYCTDIEISKNGM